eukprot:COSAG04_NODE_4767_length_1903_cov_24.929047_3_plen_122_part_01
MIAPAPAEQGGRPRGEVGEWGRAVSGGVLPRWRTGSSPCAARAPAAPSYTRLSLTLASCPQAKKALDSDSFPRQRAPGAASDESDDDYDAGEEPLVPFEKAILGFFFSGFFMCVLMLVGMTK